MASNQSLAEDDSSVRLPWLAIEILAAIVGGPPVCREQMHLTPDKTPLRQELLALLYK